MRAYKVVDVFSDRPFKGNPVAVVLDAEGLDDGTMQAIARWTNLSETTFVLPATQARADYRLRIFTPKRELPFAGHPTLGSAHAVLEAGRYSPKNGVLVQQCLQGLVRIAVEGEGKNCQLVFDLPDASITPLAPADVEELEAIAGISIMRRAAPAIIDVGAVWVVAQVANADVLLGLEPDLAHSARFENRLGVTGITLFGDHGHGEAEIEVRTFAPSCGCEEDPVCGSGNGAVAVFRHTRGLLAAQGGTNRYSAAQGQRVGRAGRIAVEVDARGKVRVGGACVTCVDGTLRDQ
ncbi:PhzF family phenazine biosynthesis protein [Acetobacter vaccinii]|nr:PhzF family phenazine biosynthesis protein [Acetobacter vaccinii]